MLILKCAANASNPELTIRYTCGLIKSCVACNPPSTNTNKIVQTVLLENAFLIVDANVGLTILDRDMIKILEANKHQIVIVANKIDKLSKSAAGKQLFSIQNRLFRLRPAGRKNFLGFR